MCQGRRHQGGQGGSHGPPTFFSWQKENREKEKVSKQKLLKGCHQGQNVTVLAIRASRVQKFLLLANIPFQCSMTPPL